MGVRTYGMDQLDRFIEGLEGSAVELRGQQQVNWGAISVYQNVAAELRKIAEEIKVDIADVMVEATVVCQCSRQPYCKFYEEAKQGEDDNE